MADVIGLICEKPHEDFTYEASTRTLTVVVNANITIHFLFIAPV
jgi:hypothetical protein